MDGIKRQIDLYFNKPYIATMHNGSYQVLYTMPYDKTIYVLYLNKKYVKALDGCKDVSSEIQPYVYNNGLTPLMLGYTKLTIFKDGKCTKYKGSENIDF